MPARRARLRSALLAAATIVGALLVIALVQLRPPAWWAPVGAVDEALATRAERFEQACVSELHRVREAPGPWAVRLREADMNAWLAARLPLWCDHAGIERVGDAQVRLTADSIELALATPALPAIAVVRLRPAVEGSSLRPTVDAVRLGRLPLPLFGERAVRSTLLALGEGDAQGELQSALVAALRNEPIDTTFELSDGRRVRLRDLEVRDGELLLEFETLPAAQ